MEGCGVGKEMKWRWCNREVAMVGYEEEKAWWNFMHLILFGWAMIMREIIELLCLLLLSSFIVIINPCLFNESIGCYSRKCKNGISQ